MDSKIIADRVKRKMERMRRAVRPSRGTTDDEPDLDHFITSEEREEICESVESCDSED